MEEIKDGGLILWHEVHDDGSVWAALGVCRDHRIIERFVFERFYIMER